MAQHALYVRLFSVRMSAVNPDALANGTLKSPDRPKRVEGFAGVRVGSVSVQTPVVFQMIQTARPRAVEESGNNANNSELPVKLRGHPPSVRDIRNTLAHFLESTSSASHQTTITITISYLTYQVHHHDDFTITSYIREYHRSDHLPPIG